MIDKIIERLKREKLIAFETLANTGDEKFDFAYLKVGNYADKAIDIVKQVAEEGGWIKCSDKKFPKFDEEVYVTLENGETTTSKFYGFGEECQGFKEFPTGVWEANQLGYEIIAWQPLPSVWKGERYEINRC